MEHALTPLPPHAFDDLHDSHELTLGDGGGAVGTATQAGSLPGFSIASEGVIDVSHMERAFLDMLSGDGHAHGDLHDNKPSTGPQEGQNIQGAPNGVVHIQASAAYHLTMCG